MEKVKFTSSANLLKAVITKQAGNWRKGLKELVQNSIDGCLTVGVTPEIRIDVKQVEGGGTELTYSDNAGGLGSDIEEIKKNFAVFGNSAKAGDKRMLGMFGMGRGQTMSMIYDPVSDTLKGNIEIMSFGKKDAFRISNIRLTDELGFDIEKIENGGSNAPGVVWKITSTTGKFKSGDVMKYIKKEFVLPFPVFVNDRRARNRPKGKKVENDLAILYIKDTGSGFELFERGLRVMKSGLFPGFSGTIVTKTPLNLNFARNDVIEDKRWEAIKDVVKESCLSWVAEGTHLTEAKEVGLLEKMASDPEVAERFASKAIIPLANGNKVSLNDIRGGKVLTAKTGDIAADDLIVSGTNVVDRTKDGHEHLEAILKKQGISIGPIEDNIELQEKRKLRTVEPNDDERAPLKFVNLMMNICGYGQRKVVVGLCDLGSALGWTDSKKFIAIRRDVLRKAMKHLKNDNPGGFWTELMTLMAHEQAHDTDDMETAVHGPAFRDRNLTILEKMVEVTSRIDMKETWRV